MNRYEQAKEMFAKYGVDTEKALTTLAGIPVSVHCWQGDDVVGFDGAITTARSPAAFRRRATIPGARALPKS